MNPGTSIAIKYLIIFCFILTSCTLLAQTPAECIFRDTLFRIDFGNSRSAQEFNLRSLKNYQRAYNNCPDDGFYSYSTETSECFNGDWITLREDHTPGDVGGKMFFVNAAYNSSAFFVANLSGFKPNTTYEFGVWMMNLRKLYGGCIPIPPDIIISLESPEGKKVTAFQTGKISPSGNPSWKKYFALFSTPADITSLTIKMVDITDGGCGNDFTMDDITFRECYPVEPFVVLLPPEPKKQEPKPVTVAKPIKEQVKETPPLKTEKLEVAKKVKPETARDEKQITRAKPVVIPVPDVIVSRANPIIKSIETQTADMLVELYDNGQIDGDTVSIYHNNQLIVTKAGLSEKPISFKISVDKNDPHHELIMVADNLGSIPPNTSLMIITGNGKRYEIFISSSEQKNAKLVIDLKKN
ncbi:MAG: hypothetical protein ABIO04_10800 [Ferruginibacter sp.]